MWIECLGVFNRDPGHGQIHSDDTLNSMFSPPTCPLVPWLSFHFSLETYDSISYMKGSLYDLKYFTITSIITRENFFFSLVKVHEKPVYSKMALETPSVSIQVLS